MRPKTPSGTNPDRYPKPPVNDLFVQYHQTSGVSQRKALLGNVQMLVGQDVPVVYLLNPNQIVAALPRVVGFTPHPLENYTIGLGLGVRS